MMTNYVRIPCVFSFIFYLVVSEAESSTFFSKQCISCVLVEQCQPLSAIFKTKPYSSHSYAFYKTVACGFDGFAPKVCCDEDVITNLYNIEKSKDQAFMKDQQINFVHKNRNKTLNQNTPHKEKLNEFCEIEKKSRIVGGIAAAIGLFPWMAKLGYTGSKMMLMRSERKDEEVVYRCGGSLITRSHVLTAAHCVVELPDNMKLHVIVLDADGTPEVRRPDKVIPHPNFNSPTIHNDLAVIKLDRPAKLSKNVIPICLPFGNMMIEPSKILPRRLMVAGWGSSYSGSKVMSSRLRYTRLTYLDSAKCKSLYMKHYNFTLGEGHFCTAPDSERDACSGDSGGPLFIWAGDGSGTQGVMVGIVSFGGKRCAAKNIPAVYTKVEAYVDWIRETISNSS